MDISYPKDFDEGNLDLLHRTFYRYVHSKGSCTAAYIGDPVKEILHATFFRDLHNGNLRNLCWHLLVMFVATLFGASCRDIFVQTIEIRIYRKKNVVYFIRV